MKKKSSVRTIRDEHPLAENRQEKAENSSEGNLSSDLIERKEN